MFILICINGCGYPGYGYRPFFNGFTPTFYNPRPFGPYGSAPYIYGPGAFVGSPYTRHPIGYWGFGGNRRIGNLALPYGFQSVRGLTNFINHKFGIRPFVNIGDSFFSMSNNLENSLRNSISGSSFNIGDFTFGIANNLERNLQSFVQNSFAPTNIMDSINNFIGSNLIKEGIFPTGFRPIGFSDATDNSAFMIIIKPINIQQLNALQRSSLLSFA